VRLPVPAAPELTPASTVWAVATAVAVYVGMCLLYLVWHPLALVPNLLLLLAAVYLIGGELWNRRFS
jgi:hypothetical protein